MNPEEIKKRISEIVAKLDEFNATENYTKEDLDTINALNEEFTNLKGNLEAKEKIEAMKAVASAPVRQTAPKVAAPKVEVTPSKLENNMGFETFGEFAKAIVNKTKGNVDRRFQNTAAYEKFAEDGGLLIPADFMTSINTKVMGDQSLLPMTDSITVSGNALSMPVDEAEPWNGGITTYWVGEGKSITESKGALKLAHWRLHKLAALVKATDELLDDAAALESYIKTKAPSAIMHRINDAIVNGDGSGKPFGILNSGFKIAVAKESGQTADTIVFKNIVKMESRFIPTTTGVWLAHPKCKEQLRQLKDDNGNAIYMNGGAFPSLENAGYDTLMGKRVIYMMGAMPTLGDEGDLILCDLKYYNTIVKGGINQEISTHLLFDQDQTAFRFIQRIDGACPYTAPVTTQYGSYTMSGFVTIAVRG